MNIHKLGFDLNEPQDTEGYPKFIVEIDNQKEDQTFLLLPLEESSKKDGIYPILNCTCGEWGCGGFDVKVKNKPDFVIWESIIINKMGNQSSNNVLHIATPIRFSREGYEDLIKELLAEKEKYPTETRLYEFNKKDFYKTGKMPW